MNELIASISQNLDVNSLESLHALLLLIETFLLSEDKAQYLEDIIILIEKAYEQLDQKINQLQKLEPDIKKFIIPPIIREDMENKKHCKNNCRC